MVYATLTEEFHINYKIFVTILFSAHRYDDVNDGN